MEPSLKELDEVVVNPNVRKDRPRNSMATVSSRTFSVEEASRYAGAIDDPGRMAGNFAGVTTVGVHLNAIVVRGNAPKGLLWRLEGVNIPVPSHFSGSNVAGGGGLTMFSSELLANSDFYTGAFSAEYGNATAGVFDMKLRNGNSYEREYAFQIGVQGIEAAAEGPFKKGKLASYLFNYRYSTMALIFPLLPEVRGDNELPVYQDLSFKINLPAKNAGTFSMWGIGGLSHTTMKGYDDTTKWEYPENRVKMNFHYNMGAIGINHSKSMSERIYIKSSLAFTANEHLYNKKSRLDRSNPSVLYPLYNVESESQRTNLSSKMTFIRSKRSTIQIGINLERQNYQLFGKARNYETEKYGNIMDGTENSWLTEGFMQGKYKFTENIYVTAGINASWFDINQEYTLEPRLAASWQFHNNHRFSFGYGNHSQIEPLFVYFVRMEDDKNEMYYPNKNLDRMKAHHLVFGYDWSITPNLRLKIEPYWQYLYDVPVVEGTAYSMINFLSDWTFNKNLTNEGTGKNVGVDFTLERFLKNGLYFMTTASLYDSEYSTNTNQTFRTRYDGGYVINVLAGKEWLIRDKDMLSFNAKLTFMGPYWHHPVDETTTEIAGEIVYADEKPFVHRHSDFESITDVTLSYRINHQRVSSHFTLQVRNVLGRQYIGKRYNIETQQIEDNFFSSPVPFFSYKLEF